MRSPSSLKVHLKTGLGNEREESFVSFVATLAIAHRPSLPLPVDAPGWPLLDACSRGCVVSARVLQPGILVPQFSMGGLERPTAKCQG